MALSLWAHSHHVQNFGSTSISDHACSYTPALTRQLDAHLPMHTYSTRSSTRLLLHAYVSVCYIVTDKVRHYDARSCRIHSTLLPPSLPPQIHTHIELERTPWVFSYRGTLSNGILESIERDLSRSHTYTPLNERDT